MQEIQIRWDWRPRNVSWMLSAAERGLTLYLLSGTANLFFSIKYSGVYACGPFNLYPVAEYIKSFACLWKLDFIWPALRPNYQALSRG